MPVILPADHAASLSRAPRAQFFANRAIAHALAMTSFDEINEQREVKLTVVAQPLPQRPTPRSLSHPQK